MPNQRTLRRLARTGDPILLSVAGHRARAVPPDAAHSPPPAPVVHTFHYRYDSDGNLTCVVCRTSRPCVGAHPATEATETVTYAGYSDAIGNSDLHPGAVLVHGPRTAANWTASPAWSTTASATSTPRPAAGSLRSRSTPPPASLPPCTRRQVSPRDRRPRWE
jgi:hypothetical protein